MASMNTHQWALAALIASLLLAQAGRWPLLWLGVAVAALGGLLWRPARPAALAVAVTLLLGGLRVGLDRGTDPWRDLDGLRVDVSGRVLGQVRCRPESLTFRFLAERVEGRPELPPVVLWAVWHAPRANQPQPLSGERWRLTARVKAPRGADYPGGFDEREWLALHHIHHTLQGWERHGQLERLEPARGPGLRGCAWRARAWILGRLRPGLNARQHALLCGVVLGETQFLDSRDEESFRAVGASHLLAASGLNVALVVGLVMGLGRVAGFGPPRMAVPALVLAAFYALLAEASPSVVRAAVMAGASLTALAVGRISDVLHSLTLACLGCLLVDPAYLQDLGFQMSVLAVLSLVWLEPGFAARLEGLPELLRRSLSGTLACTLGLLPWMVWNFQQWAPATVLANLLLGWAAELLLPLGLLQALIPPLAALNRWLLDYLLGCAALLAGWFGSGQIARPEPLQTLGLVVLVGGVGAWLYGHLSWRLLLLADLLVALLWLPAKPSQDLRLRLASEPLLAWLRLPGGPDLLLVPGDRQPAGLRMLRVNGAWPACCLCAEGRKLLRGGGLRLDLRPGSCRLTYRQVRLLLAWEEPPPEHRTEADIVVGALRWVKCERWFKPGRALELVTDGRTIRVGPWQEKGARVGNGRSCESTGCSSTSAGRIPPPTASGSES